MSKRFTVALLLFSLLTCCLIIVQPIRANSTIIVPDDYPTINSAIGNATNGDTIFVRSGFYQEQTLKINKTINLQGESALNTTICLDPPLVDTGSFNNDGSKIYQHDHIIDISADNVTFSGFTIITKTSGYISLEGSKNRVSNNNLTTGIWLIGKQNILERNIIIGNLSCGSGNENSSVIGNYIDYIWGFGYRLLIENNIIDGGGIMLGTGCTIRNNTIQNSLHAVYFMSDEKSNKIYHNNFINNTYSMGHYPYDYWSFHNFWDNGYPSGGNYWSNYNGSDSNGDGIGDTPYILDAHNQDNYPLITPIDLPSTIEELLPELIPTPTPSPTQTQTPSSSSSVSPTASPTLSPTPSPTIPEFPAWIIPSAFLIITLRAILTIREKKD